MISATGRQKTALITGANTGLGFETARMLGAKGLNVILVCRNPERCRKAKEKIMKESPAAMLEIMDVDLSRLASVREFCVKFLSEYDRLDILVNNAGIMIPPYSVTEDGFESQMGVNYFSHFLLTGMLYDIITRTPGSRIVTVSSIAHKKGSINFEDLHWKKSYYPLKAYRQSKLACLVFAFELQRRLEKAGSGTISVAAHPGVSVTELVRHIPGWLMFLGQPVTTLLTHSPEKGALPIVHAAMDEDVRGGDYFGPSGHSEWKGEPAPAFSTSMAKDPVLGKKLWKVSEELTGIRYGN